MGISSDEFYDKDRIAILPMAFCFPGYDNRGADLPPPPACAATWRAEAMSALPNIETALLVGAHAQKWHLGRDALPSVTANVLAWRRHEPAHFPLPHPSWRNNGWLARNPWFEQDLLPRMRSRIRRVLERA